MRRKILLDCDWAPVPTPGYGRQVNACEKEYGELAAFQSVTDGRKFCG